MFSFWAKTHHNNRTFWLRQNNSGILCPLVGYINCQKFKNPLEAESFIFSSFNEYKHPLLSRCGQCTIFINNPPENILDKVFDLWTNGFFIDSSNFSYNKTQASIILGLLEPTQVENSDTFDIAQITLPSFPSLGLNDNIPTMFLNVMAPYCILSSLKNLKNKL